MDQHFALTSRLMKVFWENLNMTSL